MEPPSPCGRSRSTEINPVSVGTEINIVQENLPAAIPVDACYLGWQQSSIASPCSSNRRSRTEVESTPYSVMELPFTVRQEMNAVPKNCV
jgi:hypothetical protein